MGHMLLNKHHTLLPHQDMNNQHMVLHQLKGIRHNKKERGRALSTHKDHQLLKSTELIHLNSSNRILLSSSSHQCQYHRHRHRQISINHQWRALQHTDHTTVRITSIHSRAREIRSRMKPMTFNEKWKRRGHLFLPIWKHQLTKQLQLKVMHKFQHHLQEEEVLNQSKVALIHRTTNLQVCLDHWMMHLMMREWHINSSMAVIRNIMTHLTNCRMVLKVSTTQEKRSTTTLQSVMTHDFNNRKKIPITITRNRVQHPWINIMNRAIFLPMMKERLSKAMKIIIHRMKANSLRGHLDKRATENPMTNKNLDLFHMMVALLMINNITMTESLTTNMLRMAMSTNTTNLNPKMSYQVILMVTGLSHLCRQKTTKMMRIIGLCLPMVVKLAPTILTQAPPCVERKNI
mmetsp:Transcript_18117/g.25129  ORF Transcript_18117/g.25129 Transcript_18117/m.25129 type:complete len:403 (-) Transcript_18117:919-2127(-)